MPNFTTKQLTAIENMERYLGIGNGRTDFPTYDEFDAYFKLLSKKIEKRKAFAELPKEKKSEIREKKEAKIKEWYSSAENLRKWWAEYAGKYSPSRGKLVRKLREKCGNAETAESVADSLSAFLDDETASRELAWRYSSAWKGPSYVMGKLMEKGYSKELAKAAVAGLAESGSSDDAAKTALESFRKKWIVEKNALVRKMAARGFGYSQIKAAMAGEG